MQLASLSLALYLATHLRPKILQISLLRLSLIHVDHKFPNILNFTLHLEDILLQIPLYSSLETLDCFVLYSQLLIELSSQFLHLVPDISDLFPKLLPFELGILSLFLLTLVLLLGFPNHILLDPVYLANYLTS